VRELWPAQFFARCGRAEKIGVAHRTTKISRGRNDMHSNAELVKAVAGIIGALAFFIVVIHQLTRLLG
jgi:flagellar biogenesis protein FliO